MAKQKAQKTVPEQWLASLLKSSTHAIVATDSKGEVVMMNHVAEKLTGSKQKIAAGKPLADVVRIIDRKTQRQVKIPLACSFEKSRKPCNLNNSVVLSATGKETLVDAVFTPMRDRDRAVCGTVLIFRDISSTVADEVSMMMDSQRMAAIGNIARSVAHNLNNWLSVISGHASSIADNLLPNTRAHEEAQKIINATRHAGGLAKRLLSIAKASKMNVKGAIKTDTVPLAEVVRHAINMAEGSLTGQGIKFRAADFRKTPFVEAHPDQLLDSLMNLFLNAAESMPNGGTIKINATEKTVKSRNYVVLNVRDTGPGMSPEILEHIFEPFFASEEPGSTVGLGMAVVKASVEQWGGFVQVRSKSGHGTLFRLFIPRGTARAIREVRKQASAGGETILVIDDNTKLLDELKNMLKEEGYKVYAASGSDDGISLFRAHNKAIGITIIDVTMPGKDGKHVFNSVLELDPAASIIMISGFSRDYVRAYLERGAWGFIQKPIERSQLLSNVRRMLDEKLTDAKMATAGTAAS
jgi:two-component system, cell cycle sensor histidine kinase and response regulator CckA